MRLGDVVRRVADAALPSADDARAYVALEHLAQGEPRLLGAASASEARSAKWSFARGDVLLGKLRPLLRKAALAPFDGVCSTDILVLRAEPEALPRYLLAALHTERFWAFAAASAVGTRMPRARWSSLCGYELSLPSLDAQREVARALEAMDRAVDANEAHLAQLREARRAVRESLVGEREG